MPANWWDSDPIAPTQQAPNDSGDWWKKDKQVDQSPSFDTQLVNDPSKGPEWNATQQELAASAQVAGLPPAKTGWDRLVNSVKRAQDSGYSFPHFAGTEFDPTGDRSVTMDMENLSRSLRQKEADERSAGKIDQANTTALERAYWETQAAQGMTAKQWKDQTGYGDPELPPNGPTLNTRGAYEINQADAQQYLERQAGQLGQWSDLGQVAGDAMKLPGKVGLFYGNTMAGGPQVQPHWPTDQEVQAPVISPELARAMITAPFGPGVSSNNFAKTGAQGAIRGAVEGAGDALSSFTTPESLGLLGVAPEGKLAQRLVAGVFLGQAIQGTKDQWDAFNAAPNLSDKIRIATSMGLGYALPIAGGLHSFKGENPLPPRRWPDRQVDARAVEVPKVNKEADANAVPSQPPFEPLSADNRTTSSLAPSEVAAPSADIRQTPDLRVAGNSAPDQLRSSEQSNTSQPDFKQGSSEVNAPSVQEVPLASTQGEFPPKANPEPQGVPRTVQGQAFVPSTEWQEVPPNTVLPNGGEYRMDQATGKNFARWKPENLEEARAQLSEQRSKSQYASSDQRSPSEPNPLNTDQVSRTNQQTSQPDIKPTSTGIATGIERVNDDPFVSRIANRFTQERATQGEIGEIAPGQGYATSDLVSRGLKMAPEEIAQHVSDVMRDHGNDPVAQAAAIRAEEARLSDRSTELSRVAETNPTNLAARQAANSAFQDLTDFHNGPVAKLKQRFHATGMALQGEIPVDLSTVNGLREAWLKENGSVPPPKMDATFRRTAENVRRATGNEGAVMDILGREIDRASAKRKLPSAEEVRNRIIERMKDQPCRV